MKLISKQDFYKIIYDNDLDICVFSNWNSVEQKMTTKFTFRNGQLFGYCYTNYDTDSEYYGENIYEIIEKLNF